MTAQLPVDMEKLEKLAEVAVRVGLGLAEGQDLIITAPLEAQPLTRLISRHAYRAGAGIVTTLFSDPEATLERFENGRPASFDAAPAWLYEGMGKAYANGATRLAIVGEDPMLLSGQDADKVSRANRANSQAYKPAGEKISNFDINWNIVSYPTLAWAKRVFPNDPDAMAVAKLAKAIFAASRVSEADPVAAWTEHNANLHARADFMNGKRFAALHFTGPGTDLTVGLADEHEWHGGSTVAKNGITCNPNIPTEEVFTTPHRLRVEGHVSATKPLSHQGTLIEEIRVTFEKGRIVHAAASRGGDVLNRVLDTDEGARHLGEVALVPHSSPISASGILFYNTLYDENASCHIALGQCYSDCFINGAKLSKDEIAAKGGNSSFIHIDWMIGSNKVDIDGIDANGDATPLMRGGEWAN